MSSDVFVRFLERKLIEHGVHKVVPTDDVLEQHARRVIDHEHSSTKQWTKRGRRRKRMRPRVELPCGPAPAGRVLRSNTSPISPGILANCRHRDTADRRWRMNALPEKARQNSGENPWPAGKRTRRRTRCSRSRRYTTPRSARAEMVRSAVAAGACQARAAVLGVARDVRRTGETARLFASMGNGASSRTYRRF